MSKLFRSLLFTLLVAYSSQTNAQQAAPYGRPITLDEASQVMAAAVAEANKNGWRVVITILDSGGHLVMMQRMDNVSYGSIRIAEGKARTALDFRGPSNMFDGAIAQGGLALQLLTIPGIMPIQGAVPITSDGHVIGAIGVSGMAAPQDEQVSVAGAAALQ